MLKDFSKEQFDILIQSGQSNSEGYGFGAVEAPYQPNDLVWAMEQNFTISTAKERVDGNLIRSDLSLSFADEYIKNGRLKEGRKLLILRSAVGGTGFLDNRWRENDDLFRQMLEMIRTALALNSGNRLVGLLWHQGEAEAVLHADYETHYNHLMSYIKLVRGAFGVPDLPFIAGDFVQHWKNDNSAICEPVTKAIRAVCADCGRGAFVETDGLLSNSQECRLHGESCDDTIHFSRKSLYLLGERYYEAFANI